MRYSTVIVSYVAGDDRKVGCCVLIEILNQSNKHHPLAALAATEWLERSAPDLAYSLEKQLSVSIHATGAPPP